MGLEPRLRHAPARELGFAVHPLQPHHRLRDLRQPPREFRPAVHGLGHPAPHPLPLSPAPLAIGLELPRETRRGHLQVVALLDQARGVQDVARLVAEPLAVSDAAPGRTTALTRASRSVASTPATPRGKKKVGSAHFFRSLAHPPPPSKGNAGNVYVPPRSCASSLTLTTASLFGTRRSVRSRRDRTSTSPSLTKAVPTVTRICKAMRSASLNFTPGRSSRSS